MPEPSFDAFDEEIGDPIPGPSSAPRFKRDHSVSSMESMAHVPKRQRLSGSPNEERDGDDSNVGSVVDVPASSRPARRKKQRLSPARMKTKLSMAEPRITFVHGSSDPGSVAATSLYDFLSAEDHWTLYQDQRPSERWKPDQADVDSIAEASKICTQELRSQVSWITDVVLPLLNVAIQGLPLEVWSIQGEPVRNKYRPRCRDGKTFDSQVDLVVGLPVDPWEEDYQQRGINDRAWDFSHVNSPHTGRRFLAMGVVVKTQEQSIMEAEVQLCNWMAGLYSWGYSMKPSSGHHPATIGCAVVGEEWRFYIFDGRRRGGDDNSPFNEVVAWGPLRSLFCCTANDCEVEEAAITLRGIMGYNADEFVEQLLNFI